MPWILDLLNTLPRSPKLIEMEDIDSLLSDKAPQVIPEPKGRRLKSRGGGSGGGRTKGGTTTGTKTNIVDQEEIPPP